jgi:orotate phosphoribosyltransferase
MDVMDLLLRRKALLKGSFLLSSGKISDTYVQLCALFNKPREFSDLCTALAQKMLAEVQCDAVLAPALGAVIVGYEVAKVLDARYMFCERTNGVFKLRRDFSFAGAKSIWVVENVVTTGRSALEAIDLVRSHGTDVAGVATIVDRGGGKILKSMGLPFVSLVTIEAVEYDLDDAPGELIAMGPVKPGSR